MAAAEPSISSESGVRALADRLAIIELTGSLGLLVDARAWGEVERLFTDPVAVDYTSLNGGTPQTIPPAELVAGWASVLDRLQATQHLISGQVVRFDGDDRAACAANVQGTHVLPNAGGGPLWTVGGRYDFALARTGGGWRISALTLTVAWASGNQHIMEIAAGGA